MKTKTIIKPLTDQSGMASILITLISMIVICLIVLGFAQVSRQEQKAALNKNLSDQALYAAESGVNDAQNIIEKNIQDGTPIPAKTSCDTSPTDANYPLQPVLAKDASGNPTIQYTCLLVDPEPTSLFYSPVTDQSKIIQVQPENNTFDINQLVISWQNYSVVPPNNFSCGGADSFPAQASWNCSAGVLRIDVVPFNLESDTVLVLHPEQGSVASQYSSCYYDSSNVPACAPSSNPYVLPANCYQTGYDSMPELCNMVIRGLDTNSAGGGYYLRIVAKYGSQNIHIDAPVDANKDIQCTTSPTSSCSFYKLINDQALVDSTGQAQDVLKRIQVRVPINPLDSNVVPDNALQSTSSICKEFYVTNDSGWGESNVAGASTGC